MTGMRCGSSRPVLWQEPHSRLAAGQIAMDDIECKSSDTMYIRRGLFEQWLDLLKY